MKKEPTSVDPSVELSDVQLDRLLSGRDQLSVGEKEEVLERVLATLARPAPAASPARLRVPRWAWALLLLVTLPPVAWMATTRLRGSAFTSRGGSPAAPSFRLACLDGAGRPGPCAIGGRLTFEVSPARFRAFAAVALAPDGRTLWYFPHGDTAAGVELGSQRRRDVLDEAVLLDDAHVPGDYTVYGVFSAAPLDKEQVRQAIRSGAAGATVVVQRPLRVEGTRKP